MSYLYLFLIFIMIDIPNKYISYEFNRREAAYSYINKHKVKLGQIFIIKESHKQEFEIFKNKNNLITASIYRAYNFKYVSIDQEVYKINDLILGKREIVFYLEDLERRIIK